MTILASCPQTDLLSPEQIPFDYLAHFDKLKEYFSLPPNIEYVPQVIQFKEREYRTDRKRLVKVLLHYNAGLSASSQTMEAIKSLQHSSTYAVVTGQQAGLLTGPAVTIYKALSVIKLCGLLNERYPSYRFVPVFWAATEDSDLSEADNFSVLSRDDEVKTFRLNLRKNMGRPIGEIGAHEVDRTIINFLEAEFIDSEFKVDLLGMISDSLAQARTLGDFFSCLIMRLFAEQGLILLDPMKREFKDLARELLGKEIEDPLTLTRQVEQAGDELESLGYMRPISKTDNACSFFLVEKEGRRQVYHGPARGFWTSERGHSRQELLKILRETPQKFTTCVYLRPLFQDFLLPTVVYVGGPGEINYIAQLKEVYQARGMTMPIIYPRASCTLLEPKVTRWLRKYEIDPLELKGSIHHILKRFNQNSHVDRFQQRHSAVLAEMDGMMREVEELDPTLGKALARGRRTTDKKLREMSKRIEERAAEKGGVEIRQISKLKTHIFPLDRPQEGVINIFSFLVKGGLDLLNEISEAINVERPDHPFIAYGSRDK
ncbi:MAG: putative cysteine ligase BshC [Actinobacteria bacterium]|nr:putative cysteine ligase BshC [Actinomycetota bacterium]